MVGVPNEMTAALLLGRAGLDRIVIRDDMLVPVPVPWEVLVRVGACQLKDV